ncbi:hypothetical protein [Vibrio fortis]|uniref:hypothetical protein n=1 Tax=Vibrio fortis TaxID=212667 RepID=UPI003EB9D2B2
MLNDVFTFDAVLSVLSFFFAGGAAIAGGAIYCFEYVGFINGISITCGVASLYAVYHYLANSEEYNTFSDHLLSIPFFLMTAAIGFNFHFVSPYAAIATPFSGVFGFVALCLAFMVAFAPLIFIVWIVTGGLRSFAAWLKYSRYGLIITASTVIGTGAYLRIMHEELFWQIMTGICLFIAAAVMYGAMLRDGEIRNRRLKREFTNPLQSSLLSKRDRYDLAEDELEREERSRN